MIPDAAVHAAAEAVYGCGFDGSPQKDAWLRDFRVALEAAAPHIRAQELETAATVIAEGPGEVPDAVSKYLRRRAARIRGGQL